MNKFAEIKKLIPYGGIKEIAKRSNSSVFAVSRVLNKGVNNPIIIKSLTQYLKEIKDVKQEFDSVLNELNEA